MKKVLLIFGTRPEAIKMAPVAAALRSEAEIDVKICVTAQHRSMLDQVLSLFKITPDFDLNLMSDFQTLEGVSARILESLSIVLREWKPDLALVHGDTTTTAMASLACFYNRVPVGHVEAGLRTGDIMSPWPEELNRRITSLISCLHFAPTDSARTNLISEKIASDFIEVTGNTVIDALLQVTARLKNDFSLIKPLEDQFQFIDDRRKLILVTGHRRENFGGGVEEICKALASLSQRNDIQIIYAVHLNPNIKGPVEKMLNGRPNIHLIPPQDYLSFVYLMMKSFVILTDSGGIQEEAPSIGKPVLVMRESTERPEAVEAGTAKLVGANADKIVKSVEWLMDDPVAYRKMSTAQNPYGDGVAAIGITKRIKKYLNIQNSLGFLE